MVRQNRAPFAIVIGAGDGAIVVARADTASENVSGVVDAGFVKVWRRTRVPSS